MGTATALPVSLKKGRVWGFLAFSHGWTWLFWALASLWGTSIWRPPAVLLFAVGGAGVPLGGIVMSRLAYGSAGLRDLGRRVADRRDIGGSRLTAGGRRHHHGATTR